MMKKQQEPILETKEVKPPSIFVHKIGNIQPLTKMLNSTVRGEYEIKIMRNEQIKIQPKTTQAYFIIVKELQKKGYGISYL